MEAHSQLVDVCIVCALPEEARAFLEVVQQQCKVTFEEHTNTRLATIKNDKGEPVNLHVSWLPRYGPQEMVLHLTHVLEEYQPRLAVMTGICAGDKQHVHLGDLVIAERTFTADSGKLVTGEQGQTLHQYDTITYLLNEHILRFVPLFEHWKELVVTLSRPRSKRHQRDWLLQRLLREATASVRALPLDELAQQAPDWRQIVHEFQQGAEPVLLPSLVLRDKEMIERLQYGLDPFPFLDPPEARCHIRPLASSGAVRSDNPFQEIQVPVRGAIAVDMEGAAFGRVMQNFPGIPWLIVKGVSDYADQDKDDSYHDYSARASALYALSFIQAYVTDDRLSRPNGPRPSSDTEDLQRQQAAHIRESLHTLRNQSYSLSKQLTDGSVLIAGSLAIANELRSRLGKSAAREEFWHYLDDDHLLLSVAVVGWQSSSQTKLLMDTVGQVEESSLSLSGNLEILLYPVQMLVSIVDDAYSSVIFVHIFSAIRDKFCQKHKGEGKIDKLIDVLTLELQGNASLYVKVRYLDAINLLNGFIRELSDRLLNLDNAKLIKISKIEPKEAFAQFTRTDSMKVLLNELRDYIPAKSHDKLLKMVEDIAISVSKEEAGKKVEQKNEKEDDEPHGM
jgi:nucleoside phosphorylase